MVQTSKKETIVLGCCIFLTVLTEAIHSVWAVFLLQEITETILQERVHAPHLLVIFALSVLAGAMLEILRQKLRYLLYRERTATLEDRLISACRRRGAGGREAFVLIQNTVDDFVSKRTDWALECSGILGVSLLSAIYVCPISPQALLICFSVTGISLCLMWRSSQRIPHAARLSNEKMNAVYGELWNYLKCKEILPFLQPNVFGKYEEKVAENQQGQVFLGRQTNTARICARLGSVAVALIALAYFGLLTIQGHLSLPKLLAITMLLPGLAESMLRIPDCIAQHKKLAGMGKNIAAFLEKDPLGEESGTGECQGGERQPLEGRIESIRASGIAYSYQEGECHCRVEELWAYSGCAVGIYGESGAGKTTLLRIILGDLQGTAGECLINEHRVESLLLPELWSHILYLPQDPVILPASLRENITLEESGSGTDEERYLYSLEKAGIAQLAASRGEEELDESILSSGEIQKICLARCFYTDREVLLLDEATNAMSSDAEQAVLRNLIDDVARRGRILLLVSHNPSVIDLCGSFVGIQKDTACMRE